MDRFIFAPAELEVITPVPQGRSRTWTWDQKDHYGNSVQEGCYQVQLVGVWNQAMNRVIGDYTFRFYTAGGLLAVAKAQLDVQAVGQIHQGPIVITVEINVPVLVNGIPMTTPVSLQLDLNKPVILIAPQQVTVTILGLGQRTLSFKQWECDGQISSSTAITFTLTKDTTCRAVYVEGE